MISADISRGEIERLIESWIFSERDRHLLRRRLSDGVRIEALAEEFDLSVSQVKRIINKGRAAIESHSW